MTDRVTKQDLENLVRRINRMTGNAETPYSEVLPTDDAYQGDGKRYRANVGNYHLSGAYGGYALHRMETTGGGISDALRSGHVSKRELRDAMFAWIAGFEAREAAQ